MTEDKYTVKSNCIEVKGTLSTSTKAKYPIGTMDVLTNHIMKMSVESDPTEVSEDAVPGCTVEIEGPLGLKGTLNRGDNDHVPSGTNKGDVSRKTNNREIEHLAKKFEKQSTAF